MVVSIVALLVALLLPALGKAREAARTAVCLSNLRQISMGFGLYYGESNQWMPVGSGYVGIYPAHVRHLCNGNASWGRVVAKTLQIPYQTEAANGSNFDPLQKTNRAGVYPDKDNGIFQCPTEIGIFTNGWGGTNSTSYLHNSGYAKGRSLGIHEGWSTMNQELKDKYGRVHLTQVVRPANTFVLAEGIADDGYFGYDYRLNQFMNSNSGPMPLSTYHNGWGNVLWVDGHAERRTEELASEHALRDQ